MKKLEGGWRCTQMRTASPLGSARELHMQYLHPWGNVKLPSRRLESIFDTLYIFSSLFDKLCKFKILPFLALEKHFKIEFQQMLNCDSRMCKMSNMSSYCVLMSKEGIRRLSLSFIDPFLKILELLMFYKKMDFSVSFNYFFSKKWKKTNFVGLWPFE